MANVVELIIRGNDQSAKAIASSLQGLKGMESVIGTMKGQLAGFASLGALTAFAKSAIDMGSALSDASKKFGIAGSELSKLSYMAKMSGVEFEGLGNGLKFLSKSMSEITDSGSEAAKAFALIGISAKDIKGLSTEKTFELVADSLAQYEDGANKTALALKLFGRAGADMLPMMEKGGEGIRKAKEAAVEMGLAMSDDQIKKLDDIGDAIDTLGMKAKATAGKIIVNFVGALQSAWKEASRWKNITDSQEFLNMQKGFGGATGGATGGVGGEWDSGKKKLGSVAGAGKSGKGPAEKKIDDGSAGWGAAAQVEMDLAEETARVLSGITKNRIESEDKLRQFSAEKWAEYYESQASGEEANILANYDKWIMSEQSKVDLAMEYADIYKTAWLDANMAVTDSFKELYGGMQSWISSSLQGLIEGTMEVADVMRNLGSMMLQIITDYVAKWVVSRVFMAAFEKAAAAAEIANAIVTGGAVAAAWAPAAAMVSLATFGGNSAPAMAGLAATSALAQALAIPALAEGGIVDRPTVALIGESGPEAVVPLDKGGGTIQLLLDGDVLATWINRNAGRYGRIQLVPA